MQNQKDKQTQSRKLPFFRSQSLIMDNFDMIMENNRIWAKQVERQHPGFFKQLVEIQRPQFLWIGCSDSRVPANQIVGLKPGQLFVHRNVANLVPPSDINVLAVIQYSVQVLKVKDIIVTGHYGCGGVRAAFKKHDHGPLQSWLSHLRDLRWRHTDELNKSQQENEDLLVQLNVKSQVYNVARIPSVQTAWAEGQQLRIHGLVYRLGDGILKDLGITLGKISDIPQQFHIIQDRNPKKKPNQKVKEIATIPQQNTADIQKKSDQQVKETTIPEEKTDDIAMKPDQKVKETTIAEEKTDDIVKQ